MCKLSLNIVGNVYNSLQRSFLSLAWPWSGRSLPKGNQWECWDPGLEPNVVRHPVHLPPQCTSDTPWWHPTPPNGPNTPMSPQCPLYPCWPLNTYTPCQLLMPPTLLNAPYTPSFIFSCCRGKSCIGIGDITSWTLSNLCRLLCVVLVVVVVTVSLCCSSSPVIVDPQLQMNNNNIKITQ